MPFSRIGWLVVWLVVGVLVSLIGWPSELRCGADCWCLVLSGCQDPVQCDAVPWLIWGGSNRPTRYYFAASKERGSISQMVGGLVVGGHEAGSGAAGVVFVDGISESRVLPSSYAQRAAPLESKGRESEAVSKVVAPRKTIVGWNCWNCLNWTQKRDGVPLMAPPTPQIRPDQACAWPVLPCWAGAVGRLAGISRRLDPTPQLHRSIDGFTGSLPLHLREKGAVKFYTWGRHASRCTCFCLSFHATDPLLARWRWWAEEVHDDFRPTRDRPDSPRALTLGTR